MGQNILVSLTCGGHMTSIAVHKIKQLSPSLSKPSTARGAGKGKILKIMLLTLIHPLNIYIRIQCFLITLTPLSSYIDKIFDLINTFDDVSMVSSGEFLNTSCRYVIFYKTHRSFSCFRFSNFLTIGHGVSLSLDLLW